MDKSIISRECRDLVDGIYGLGEYISCWKLELFVMAKGILMKDPYSFFLLKEYLFFFGTFIWGPRIHSQEWKIVLLQ